MRRRRPNLGIASTSKVITVRAVSSTAESIGIIAGNRSLPLLFARQARAAGVKRLVAVAFEGETDPAIAALVDEVVWVKVGQLAKMIAAFTDRGVKQCVMLGQIAPKNLYHVRPDLRGMAVLFKLKERNAHTIFGAIADELQKDGVELIEATPWLQPLMPGAGFQLGRKLSAEQREDVAYGFGIAKEISRLEIGQLVVVKAGTVLAVEGFEGTDKCLARGGSSAGIALSFPYLCVAGQEKGLGIIDVSNPSKPTLAGTFNKGGWTRDVDLAGNLAYTAVSSQGLQIVDIANPASPVLLGSYGGPSYDSTGVQVVGQTAYLVNANGRVLIPVDVSNATKPVTGYPVLYGPNGSGNFNGILVQGGIYIPNDTGLAFSITPSLLTGVYWVDSLPSYDVAVNGSMAYLGRAGRWDIIDLSNPSQPRNVSKVPSGNVYSIHYVDDFVFTSHGGGLQVFDSSNPQRPRMVGQFVAPGIGQGGPSTRGTVKMIVRDNLIYLAEASCWGLWVLEFSAEIFQDGAFALWRPAEQGKRYILESKNNVNDCCWTTVATNTAQTESIKLTDSSANGSQRFYRMSTLP